MKMKPSKVLLMLSCVLMSSGCVIKEYRESCPCRLVLDFSEVDTAVAGSADLYLTVPGGYVFSDTWESEAMETDYTVTVPRTWLNVNVVSGDNGYFRESGLRIPFGKECPSVYMHSSTVNADCEIWREVVRMRKNYCAVNISTKTEEGQGLSLRLLSNVCGYDVNGMPVEGPFRCDGVIDGEGLCRIVIPRQTDDHMMMEIIGDDGVVKRFALGYYIAASGYDWTAADLKDIDLELDLAVVRLTIRIQGWDKEQVYDIVI